MERKNVELHQCLKSIPESDFVLDVFPAALQKDIAIQGKCFLTQNRVCFYSNILGFVNYVHCFKPGRLDVFIHQGNSAQARCIYQYYLHYD